jgi:hypothetical protein
MSACGASRQFTTLHGSIFVMMKARALQQGKLQTPDEADA